MKKLSILFIALALTLTACSSDDSSPEISGSIVGVWKGVSVDYSGTTVTSAQGQTVSADYIGEAYDVDYSLTFTENPNNIIPEGSYSIELTTTIAGQTTVSNVEDLEVADDGVWAINDDELQITTSSGETTMKILALSDSILVLVATEETDLSQSGVSVISTTDIIFTFERQ